MRRGHAAPQGWVEAESRAECHMLGFTSPSTWEDGDCCPRSEVGMPPLLSSLPKRRRWSRSRSVQPAPRVHCKERDDGKSSVPRAGGGEWHLDVAVQSVQAAAGGGQEGWGCPLQEAWHAHTSPLSLGRGVQPSAERSIYAALAKLPLLLPSAPLPAAGPAVPQQDTPSEDSSTPTLDLQPQPHSPGEDTPPAPPTPAAQWDEGAEEGSASPLGAAGDTTSLPTSLQASLAALREDFGCWTRAHLQHTDELLGVTACLLQAHCRLNKHLVSLSRGVHSMARSLSAISSSMGTMLQPRPQDPRSVPAPQDPPDLSWPSLPSNLPDLFCPSTSQQNEADRGPAASPPAAEPPARPPSPKAPSPALEEEHPSRGKQDWKHTAGLRKRRKK